MKPQSSALATRWKALPARSLLPRSMPEKACQLLRAFAGALAAVLAAYLLFSALVFFVPRGAAEDHLRTSQEVMERFRRADTYTECLVLGAAVIEEKEVLRGLFDFPKWDAPPCEALKGHLEGKAQGHASYMRYWNAPALLARLVFSFLPYGGAFALYLALSCVGLSLWACVLIKSRVSLPWASGTALFILWCGGFAFYGGNIAHAPAFFIPLLALAFAGLRHAWWDDDRRLVRLAAIMGALTCAFDMLFGAIPFNLSLFLFTLVLLRKEKPWRGMALAISGFLLAGGLFLVIKYAGIGALNGYAVMAADILGQLTLRMGSHAEAVPISLVQLYFQHLPEAAAKIYGAPFIYHMLFALAVLAFLIALAGHARTALPALAVGLIVPLWMAAFPNHSWVHSFMSRLLFWPVLFGFLALALVLHAKGAKMTLPPIRLKQ